MADIELVIKIPEEIYKASQIIDVKYEDTIQIPLEVIANGIPFQEISDRENSEIKNEVKDLSKRVETLEKQIREDKEERLNKLKAEVDLAKFRCALSPWTL